MPIKRHESGPCNYSMLTITPSKSKFDASFFGVHPKQAHAMDPQLRMLLEVVHEAIADAGKLPLSQEE